MRPAGGSHDLVNTPIIHGANSFVECQFEKCVIRLQPEREDDFAEWPPRVMSTEEPERVIWIPTVHRNCRSKQRGVYFVD